MLALIPARSGSVRVPNKNIKYLSGHPLISYTIASALESKLFSQVVVCTDSQQYASIAQHYGATVPDLRPASISRSNSPDREWIRWVFSLPGAISASHEHACILRPTNPFRTSTTIKRAYSEFSESSADTLRAVRKVSEHPGKMWVMQGEHIVPLIPLSFQEVPFHSNQSAVLFDAYVQDASLEIFSISNFHKYNQITGSSILPFHCLGNEGLDINLPEDFALAESLAHNDPSLLPSITASPFNFKQ